MKAGKMLVSMVLALVVISGLVFAAGSISITSVSIPSSVTQGDTFTITVSVSGSQATSVSGTLTLPSGLSCTPTSSQTISLGGGGTGSASWSCTANVAGDYTNRITASVSATDSGTGGSLSASQQTGLTVLTPASLTASSTFKPTSINNGSTSTFTVGVNNLGDSSTTFNISLSCQSGLTCPSNLGNTAISGKSLVNTPFTITVPSTTSAGNYIVTATIYSPVQASMTTSSTLSVTVSTSSTTTTTSSSSSSSAATGTPTTTPGIGNVTVSIPSIATGSNVFNWGTVTGLYVTALGINANGALSNVQLVVNTLSAAPSGTPSVSGSVFNYFLVTPTNITDSNVYNVTLSFFVPKSWASTNNVNASTIALYRYANNAWNALTTTKTSDDSSNYYFIAYSPGFSNYAIAGQPSPSAVTNITNQTGNQSKGNATLPGAAGLGTTIVIILGVIAAAVILAVLYLIRNKKLKALGLKPTGKWGEVKKKWAQ